MCWKRFLSPPHGASSTLGRRRLSPPLAGQWAGGVAPTVSRRMCMNLSIHTAPIVRRSLYWPILGPGLLSFSIASAVAYLFLVGMLSKRPFIVRLGDDNRHVAG